MKKITGLIIILLLVASDLLCQTERGTMVEVEGPDLINTLNNSSWILKKVIDGDGYFARKRKAGKLEEWHLSFKDSIVRYYNSSNNIEFFCGYANSTKDLENDYMCLTIFCQECNYYWIIYRQSEKKLVLSMSVDIKKNGQQRKFERYVFYRE